MKGFLAMCGLVFCLAGAAFMSPWWLIGVVLCIGVIADAE